ncbi:MAG: hypothetical protein RI637_05690 [Acidimicrobiia bacterium]|nr:hypothetical protein [Acidimicrobiia bacterium]
MMRRCLAALAVLVVVTMTPAGVRAASDISVDELLAGGAAFDGRTITVIGELIGDYGFRRDGSAWSQLNGDSYATGPLLEGGDLTGSNAGIGVRAPAALIENLDPPGDYHHRGPLIRATGIWKYHDEDRAGETYLDVVLIEVLEPGRVFDETANPAVLAAGAMFLLTALWLGYRSRRRSAD